ncbi:agmatinase [Brevundimonas sp.]|uniref:agmatinase n=1 Tax=Brevundimonas sp. TaxID=1871086 RepID=UPI002631FA4F|nr:agmatinase [Brevundimonas sp.]
MDFTPLSGRDMPRFAGLKTFFRLPVAPIEAAFDVALVGVPFDGGASYRPGSRFAPARVREVSSLGRGYHWSRALNWVDRLKAADVGDVATVPVSGPETYARIEAWFDALLVHDKRFIAVGGDHSTTLPILRAAAKKHGRLNVVHFDAHLDTYPAAWGQEFHHGAFMRHAVEEGLVEPTRVLQIGIRGPLAGGEDLEFTRRHGIRVTTVDDIRIGGLEAFIAGLPVFDQGPTYITFDIDCLDPAFAPGTGTPVPGGLTTYETQRILRALKVSNLVGGDVMEVSPPYDVSDITSLAAVDVMFEMLALMAEG